MVTHVASEPLLTFTIGGSVGASCVAASGTMPFCLSALTVPSLGLTLHVVLDVFAWFQPTLRTSF